MNKWVVIQEGKKKEKKERVGGGERREGNGRDKRVKTDGRQ